MRLITTLAATFAPENMLTVSLLNTDQAKTLYAKESPIKSTKFEDLKKAQVQNRRLNQIKRIVALYQSFKPIPYFLRDFTAFSRNLDVRNIPEGTVVYDYNNMPACFYVVISGRVKLEEQGSDLK